MFITLPSNLFSSESAETEMIVKTIITYLYLNNNALQQGKQAKQRANQLLH